MKLIPALGATALIVASSGCGSSAPPSAHDYLQQRIEAAASSFGAAPSSPEINDTPTVCLDELGGGQAQAAQAQALGVQGCALQHRTVAGTNDAVRSLVRLGSSESATRFIEQQRATGTANQKASAFDVGFAGGSGEDDWEGGVLVARGVTFQVGGDVYYIGGNVRDQRHPITRNALVVAATAWHDAVAALK